MRKIYYALAVVMSFFGVSAAFADCRTTPVNYSFSANAEMSADGVTAENGFCRISFSSSQGFYTDVNITKKPKNGKLVQINVTTFEYRTNPNFKGKDQFTFEACGASRTGSKGCAIVTFNMATP